ncbi:sialate O-acetylesterase [uncultured Algibacter sp.]|uniref:sialate O-acetylesterase n=1 Tax=uncultured Algibacter sp. TaxID=298659 RepID=UPI00262A52D7|nr:sialate O-acetylesterase [uncultured Algibacter sp.]
MNRIILIFTILLFPLVTFSQKIEKDSIRLFYLGGQSNMDGFGMNSELPDSINVNFKNVWIFHGNPAPDNTKNGGLGKWSKLKPGHGYGFSYDGKKNNLSERFGIEMSFSKKLQEYYPNEKIAIIKYSRSGTSIDSLAARQFGSWDPDYKGAKGINQYDHFLSTIKNAFNDIDIDNNGIEDYLIPSGILWMQGESDAAFSEKVANRYYDNLNRLMSLIRAALFKNDIPVVIGKISDSWDSTDSKVYKYGELVQYAQEKYARTDKNAEIVRHTRYYKYSDTWHYDNDGFLDLGLKFAEAIYRLNEE